MAQLVLVRGLLIAWFKIQFLGEPNYKFNLDLVMWDLALVTPF